MSNQDSRFPFLSELPFISGIDSGFLLHLPWLGILKLAPIQVCWSGMELEGGRDWFMPFPPRAWAQMWMRQTRSEFELLANIGYISHIFTSSELETLKTSPPKKKLFKYINDTENQVVCKRTLFGFTSIATHSSYPKPNQSCKQVTESPPPIINSCND